MATYTINAPNGQIPFTGWTPTLSAGGPANAGSTAGSAQMNGISQEDYRVIGSLGTQANKAVAAILTKLLGNAAGAGGNAVASNVRVQGAAGSPGGLQTIETVSLVNRVTTANDIAAFTALFGRTTFPTTYPPDLSGNGGGGHPWW